MNSVYTQKNDIVQKVTNSNAESVMDSSSQNDSLQRKADMANGTAQRAADPRPNHTGLPDDLKTGIESLSGFSMDDVRVHYNSSKPASVQALAYTQGTDIHVAPGQEQHLPHEAWHVAQQMAGRVAPTTNINGMPVNDNAGLEHEADVMGERALQRKKINISRQNTNTCVISNVIQECKTKRGKNVVHSGDIVSYVGLGLVGGKMIYYFKSDAFDKPSTELSKKEKQNLKECIEKFKFGGNTRKFSWRYDNQGFINVGETKWINCQIQLNGVKRKGEKTTYAVLLVPNGNDYKEEWIKECLLKSSDDLCKYVMGTKEMIDAYRAR